MMKKTSNKTQSLVESSESSSCDSMQKNAKTFSPNADEIGIRADIFIAKALQISRSQTEKLFSKSKILLNGIPLQKHGIALRAEDILTIQEDAPQVQDLQLKALEIPILYQDEDLLILNKPADLIVHRTNDKDTQRTLTDWLHERNFPLSNLGDSYRAGIVHRLDKSTSGAIVIAKTNFAHENLKQQLQARQMGRYYLCVIDQALKESQIVDSPLMRHPKNRLKYITVNKNNPNAKSAKTAFFKIAIANLQDCELIGAKLFSGRTHQIRAHLSSLNRHILGDFFYGYSQDSKHNEFLQNRIFLHSHLLYLKHPKSNELLHFYASLPAEIQDFLKTHFTLTNYRDSYGNLIFPLDHLYQSSFFITL